MPYTNIVFVKFRLELLSDTRFLDGLDDDGKLLFMGLLLLAGFTHNNIPNNPIFIKRQLNLSLSEAEIAQKVAQICSIFPKTIGNSQSIKFKNFNKLHNWVGSKIGEEKDSQEKIRKDKDKIRIDIYKKEFLKRFEEVTGVPYIFNYGKDNLLLKELLVFEEKDCLALINEFFDSKGEWWSDKLSIGVFKTVIPRLIGRLRKK